MTWILLIILIGYAALMVYEDNFGDMT